jgi:hypothetical protein
MIAELKNGKIKKIIIGRIGKLSKGQFFFLQKINENYNYVNSINNEFPDNEFSLFEISVSFFKNENFINNTNPNDIIKLYEVF